MKTKHKPQVWTLTHEQHLLSRGSGRKMPWMPLRHSWWSQKGYKLLETITIYNNVFRNMKTVITIKGGGKAMPRRLWEVPSQLPILHSQVPWLLTEGYCKGTRQSSLEKACWAWHRLTKNCWVQLRKHRTLSWKARVRLENEMFIYKQQLTTEGCKCDESFQFIEVIYTEVPSLSNRMPQWATGEES